MVFKSCRTNNTINQTIVLNNYGNEDLSHITNSMLDKLIKAPCEMINNLTKLIHFNGQISERVFRKIEEGRHWE